MIKPQDIRPGNYFFYSKDNILIPADIHQVRYCNYRNKQFNNNYKPIPITPEILEAAYYMENNHKQYFQNEYGVFFIESSGFYFQWFSKRNQFYIRINEPVKVQLDGFHHLQNILYDLAKIELTL